MAESTLEQVFGARTTQSATSITIPKTNLTSLTPAVDNGAESPLLEIVQKGTLYLNPAALAANPGQSLIVGYAGRDLTTRDGKDNIRHKYLVSAYVATVISGVTSDDV